MEVGEFEKRWNSFELTRLKITKSGLQEKPVSISNIKVGDLVYLKGDSISPADILVLDTSNTRHADKIFHVSERKVTGDNKTSTKFAIRNFHTYHKVSRNTPTANLEPSNILPTKQSALQAKSVGNQALNETLDPEAKDKIIKKLVGHIEYDFPSPEAEFGGSFKIKNDPKVSRITKDNILFCGTKLYTNW
jgi:magnesium-transporting ATPase (P-type)